MLMANGLNFLSKLRSKWSGMEVLKKKEGMWNNVQKKCKTIREEEKDYLEVTVED